MARVDGAEIENTSEAVSAREAALLPARRDTNVIRREGRPSGPRVVECRRGKRFYPGRQSATLACSHETQGVPIRRIA